MRVEPGSARHCRVDRLIDPSISRRSPVRGMVQQSRYADLLVLGQHDPDDPLVRSLPSDFVGVGTRTARGRR
jgi:hypothetical protein